MSLIGAAGYKSASMYIITGRTLNTVKLLTFTFLSAVSSQGQIHKYGSVGSLRHWLLHYVVLVKPLTLCHSGLSLSMVLHRGGSQNSHQIKAHSLCLCFYERQVWQENQLDTIHCYWSHWNKRFSILLSPLVFTHCSDRETQTNAIRNLCETGNQDRNPLTN